MNTKKTKGACLLVALLLAAATAVAQGVKPLPSIHVEGRWLVDTHGNHVVLHGVMDTPNAYFNGGRWGWDYSSVTPCLNYFEKCFAAFEKAKCTVFRLHLDPVWTNDPSSTYVYAGSQGQPADAKNEADISKFNPNRLKSYLTSLYVPLMTKAINHRQYVVVRPPGVCPQNLKVGDYYQKYLLEVWDMVSKNATVQKNAGQISLELANEPVNVRNANNQDDAKALHDYFQPIVDKIRANGFTGIIWVPGSGYQSNYRSYVSWPIEGYNIGYAVHDYPGWYNASDDNPNPTNKINAFHDAVPVVDTNPVFISEVDWSPLKEPKEIDTNPDGSIKYNEWGQPVYKNLGTWATGSTSKWGKAFKAVLDKFENISMTLTHPSDFIDLDKLMADGTVTAAFGGNPEACGQTCMEWYADYYTKDWPHADFTNVYSSDQQNGKYKNPVVFGDFPDPDVIRVGDTYYMVSTTMHNFPGATILKSKDLVNWEYCAQPLAELAATPNYSLENGQDAYGAGMWACSMKYHNGVFYLLINGNDTGGWLLTATDPEGKWETKKLSRIYYDPGMLFDNGKVYVACGITNIQMCELDENFNFIKEQNVISNVEGLEGSHLYKIGDYYYIYATNGGNPSGQSVYRSKNIFGPYEGKVLLEKQINNKNNTVHQGALIDTPEGEWWTILQEDIGALGRVPNLQPVKWVDGWPVIGNNGVPYTTYNKPSLPAVPRQSLPTNDNFRSYPLGMQWEWNHNPDNGAWTLFERPGWLRLKTTGKADRLSQARNMLTQRIFVVHGKEAQLTKGTIKLDASHLAEGDRAGLCILQDPYAYVAVERKNGKLQLVWRQDQIRTNNGFTVDEKIVETVDIDDVVYLRAAIFKGSGKTRFYYSTNNSTFTQIGGETTLWFNLSIFVGARYGLFCMATQDGSDGYADFDWFSTEENYDEVNYYPAEFAGYSEDMLTVESLTLSDVASEVMVGNSGKLDVVATYRDGHSENVAAQARYETDASYVIEIRNGRIFGLAEGTANVRVYYTDPLGNEKSQQFTVRSTFFPFGKQFIKTDFFANGTYTESNHTFQPGQYGQMGWEYPNGADMSGYKYLVIKLAATSSDSHLNIFTEGSIWSPCCATPDFGSKKQIVLDLSTAKYTSDSAKKGQPLDTKNIRIVSFWGNGSKSIRVSDMYLTNNSDYSPEVPTAINTLHLSPLTPHQTYDLMGRQTTSDRRGLVIVRTADGQVRKIFKK
jgi:beta-xylosidase